MQFTTRSPGRVRHAFEIVAGVIGSASLAGWLLDVPRLYTYIAQRPALSPMTALGLLVGVAAAAAVRTRAPWSATAAGTQVALGSLIVAAHAVGWPGRGFLPVEWWSSPLTGIGFAVSGAANALLAARRVVAGQCVAFAMLLVLVLFGFAYVLPGADLYDYLPGTGVALPTVLALMALSLAQLLSFPEAGPFAALTSRSTSGGAAVRLFGASAAGALLVTLLVVLGFRRGAFDAETAVLLVAWSAMGLLGISLWGFAAAVHRAEQGRAQAESDRRQLGQMIIAAVTHDLRSPLQAAALAATLLEHSRDAAASRAALERLQRSHRRLDRLLRSLLDSLALDARQTLSLAPSHVALHALVEEVVQENEAVLGRRVDVQGQAEGWWDRDALYRVVENLLLNAVKYGTAATPIRCRIAPAGTSTVALTVTNEGVPIAAQDWEDIFLPFARAVDTAGAPPTGWGVGLAYARTAVVRHGGTVRVAKSDAQGTTFEIVLPVDPRPSRSSSLEPNTGAAR